MASSQVSLIGVGRVFIGLRSGGKLRFVGQVKEFKLTISEKTEELKDYVNGGGLADSVSFIEKVEASLTFASLSVKNLALALRGVDGPTEEITKNNEEYIAYQGGLIPLEGVGLKNETVTVAPATLWTAITPFVSGDLIKPTVGTHFYRCKTAGTSGTTAPTWKTDGTDTTDGTITWTDMGTMALTASEYELTSAGIFIPETSTKISPQGTPVKVTCTTSAGSIIQTLVNAGEAYRIVFAGKNFARAGSPLSVDLFRVKFSPVKDLSFIGESFAELPLTASVLSDDTRTGVGLSSFCKIEL
ncbi:MAG: hypothetical protein HQL76_06275 [Magnetococcales bacterium]|nr:hypothetical protein [Magnetococcales bacterium]